MKKHTDHVPEVHNKNKQIIVERKNFSLLYKLINEFKDFLEISRKPIKELN